MPEERPASERFSLTLTPLGQQALTKIMATDNLPRPDAVNRALQAYAFLAEELKDGKALMLRDKDGNLERVHII
ncbi:hypothetical protein ACIG0C_36695 [Kitasatospora aureofaciens]|uniref:Uncharacterized protein n=1 Tax=Kitasatospora aureofaciens TaxID=1894 RepID=A0A1E7NAQ7_KITAU|nr:hypothetical protein [Kitasatospora aureofaciens]ARF78094.1 hypothetical protein B6264_03430 [Kitasatospora aureofaciens]OEV37771.1 hypothetical protein HS99_0024570 [Kitasatospora aureofaciens]GGV08434.1 hypothetical protein GCM10010502_74220 [Kitasatospora aureofaciens]